MDQQPFYQQEPNTPMPAVWPPAPQGSGLMQIDLRVPFKTRYEVVQGSMTDFRTGFLEVNQDGILIDGKAVTRMEVQVPVLIVCLFIPYAFIPAYIVLEYAIRKPMSLQINWDQIPQIVLNSKKRRVSLMYFAANEKGIVKTYSLTTQIKQNEFSEAAAVLGQRIPEKVLEGKAKGWISPPTWVFLGGVLVSVAAILILSGVFALGGLAAHGH